jgi:hypothetical protein
VPDVQDNPNMPDDSIIPNPYQVDDVVHLDEESENNNIHDEDRYKGEETQRGSIKRKKEPSKVSSTDSESESEIRIVPKK